MKVALLITLFQIGISADGLIAKSTTSEQNQQGMSSAKIYLFDAGISQSCNDGRAFKSNLVGQKENKMNCITKNGMTVCWEHKQNRIYFRMIAPTKGWVAIGFNDSSSITGTYLLMGNESMVVEYYTISPGNFKPISRLGAKEAISDEVGTELKNETTIEYSLPLKPNNKYARNFEQKREYVMLIAFSLKDDFQHHSIMRTSVKVIL